MPSNATVTAYYTFVADSKARASQVNFNFSLYRGHVIPIEVLTATSSDITYDLGSREHSWRVGYMKSAQFRCATSTSDFVIRGQTAVTIGAAEFLFGSTTIASMDISNGIYRTSLESAANLMTTSAAGTGLFSTIPAAVVLADISALSLTITIKKGPVELSFFKDSTSSSAEISVMPNTVIGGTPGLFRFAMIRDTTTSFVDGGQTDMNAYYTGTGISVAPSAMRWVDNPGPGTYTYRFRATARTDSTLILSYLKLRAREL